MLYLSSYSILKLNEDEPRKAPFIKRTRNTRVIILNPSMKNVMCTPKYPLARILLNGRGLYVIARKYMRLREMKSDLREG